MKNLVETIQRARSVVVLPTADGDKCDQASDNREVSQDFKTAFEPAGELEVKEGVHNKEEDQMDFLTETANRRKRALHKSTCEKPTWT